MKPGSIAIVGAAETTELGRIPGLSQIELHADAARHTLADSGLSLQDVDGIGTSVPFPYQTGPGRQVLRWGALCAFSVTNATRSCQPLQLA